MTSTLVSVIVLILHCIYVITALDLYGHDTLYDGYDGLYGGLPMRPGFAPRPYMRPYAPLPYGGYPYAY